MTVPSWLAVVLAISMLVLSAYSISRVVAARWWRRRVDVDVEITHSLMGLCMSAMLERGLATLPNGTWAIIFVVSGVWFAGRWSIARQVTGLSNSAPAHFAPHILASGSMVYMLVAMPSWSGMAGLICGSHMMGMRTMDMTPTKWPFVGFALAAMLIGGAAALTYHQIRLTSSCRSSIHHCRMLFATMTQSAAVRMASIFSNP
jgi:hypothetical protein